MPIDNDHSPASAPNRQSASAPLRRDKSEIGNRKCIEVSAGLVFRNGRLLITQRHPDSHQGGLWEFPGGKREPGETFQRCLVRELREELAIEVEVGPLFESVTHDYPEKTVRLEFFLCRWLKHEPQPIGCPDFRWITTDELTDFDFPAADARLIRKLREKPELWH